MFFYNDCMRLRWDKIVWALKKAAQQLKQQNCIREYDEMRWSYLYPAIAEREHTSVEYGHCTSNLLGRYSSPYLNWNQVVSAIEYAASLLLKENYNLEHEEVKTRYLTDAISRRDSYLFLIGQNVPTTTDRKSNLGLNWIQYNRANTIFPLSDRGKLLRQALNCSS